MPVDEAPAARPTGRAPLLAPATSAPLAVASSRSRHPRRVVRLTDPVGLAAAATVGTLALAWRDPHVPGAWGYCPWLVLTGGYCPGCGALRAVHDLTQGDVVAAASSNLLLLVCLPLVVLWWVVRVRRAWVGGAGSPASGRRSTRLPREVVLGAAFAALALAFAIARNLPAGSWLAP